jgi:probable rRNA maturation factor
MKKEISVCNQKLELNFFYTEELVSKNEIEDYKRNLQFLAKVFDEFIQKDLGIIKDLFILNINIVTDDQIIEINDEYRNKKKITDVLSFPMQENIRMNDYDSFMQEIELGDLFVCKSVCEEQSVEFKLTYIEEFLHLVTHGFLHVCGYDHEISDIEEKLMESLEEKILLDVSKLRSSI